MAPLQALLLAVLAAAAAAHPHPQLRTVRDVHPLTGEPLGFTRCATQEAFEYRRSAGLSRKDSAVLASPCDESPCDNPETRDATKIAPVHIRVALTVFNDAINATELEATADMFASAFAKANIVMHFVERQFVADKSHGHCIPAYGASDDWYNAIMDLKVRHAYQPSSTLNVFVTCQDSGPDGTLFGIATFPWDEIALTGYGGLWMNAIAMTPHDATLPHEAGHCFGLWHTFHGTEEVKNCQPNSLFCGRTCCEYPHKANETTAAASNRVGDMCSDTRATPKEYLCSNPDGGACTGDDWSEYGVDFSNYMSYAMINPHSGARENCQDHFSEQQMRRMHCVLQHELKSWVCDEDHCEDH
eukprot:m.293194 g.293194  ORF g.293194 m.293194 type:complete len:358 (-) comp12745_c0_seq1:92-1165(-)